VSAVDEVPEDPADPRHAFVVQAVSRQLLMAVRAGTAGGDTRDDHAVADGELVYRRPDLDYRPDTLMSEDPAVRHRWDIAFEDVQIRAADRRGVHPHDDVGGGDELRRSRSARASLSPSCSTGSTAVSRRAMPSSSRAERASPSRR
jgi:hypothetical protein